MALDITVIMVVDSHVYKWGSYGPIRISRMNSIINVYDVQQCTTKIVHNFKYKTYIKSPILDRKLTQSTKVISAKANYLSLIPRTHMVG